MAGNPNRKMDVIKAYVELIKPRSVLLLTLTGVGGLVVAAGREMAPGTLVLLVFALLLSVSGANSISNYIDRDIDAKMERTRRRPIPTNRITAVSAMVAGLLMVALGCVAAAFIGPLPLLFTLAGAVIYLLIYSSWLKRISPWNVVLGGFAGGAPAVGGWTAHTQAIDCGALLLAGLVVLWIPHHIWSLALYYANDYRRIKVPMLPAVVESRPAARCIGATVILMYVFSLLLFYHSQLGTLYLAVAMVSGAVPMLYGIWLFLRPDKRKAWVLFKISSPYLGVLFMAMIIDRLAA